MNERRYPFPQSVLLVCLGNICRSPTAEEVMRQHVAVSGLKIKVDSAGVKAYHTGNHPDPRAVEHGKQRGYRLAKLKARQVNTQDFLNFDLIMAMDEDNFHDLTAMRQKLIEEGSPVKAKVVMFSKHDPVFQNEPVPDPYYEKEAAFERVLDQCESSSKAWIERWKKTPKA